MADEKTAHFKPVSSQVNFLQNEREVLGFWKEHDVFERSMEERRDGQAVGLL